MKRAYIKNVPHNFEAQTITVSGGNHWAGGETNHGGPHQTGFNSFYLGWNSSFIETNFPPPPSKISYCKQTNLVVITIITAVVISESLSNAI